MKSLFITGASGFLGLQLLNSIRAEEYGHITLLSRREPVLPEHLASAQNINVVTASIEQVEQYAEYLDQDTRIIHLAAITGKAKPDEYFSVNTEGTRLLLDQAVSAGVAGFLYVSSIAVSFKDRRGYVYAESKEKAEKLVEESGLKYCITRPTIILGAESPIWHSFFNLAQSSTIVLPGSGKVKIQPIHVDDMVHVLLDIVNVDYFNNEILEIGGPSVLTIDEFVRKIHTECKSKEARVIHLPLGLIVSMLRLIEKIAPSLLPVNSGQFSSFSNDGNATINEYMKKHSHMKNIDDVIQQLSEINNA